MNPRKRVFSASALCLALALASACAGQGTGASQSASDAVSVSSQSQASETVITLSEDGVDIQGTGAAALVDGTVNITAGGVYRLAGALEGGVVVNAPEQAVELILAGAEIHNPDGAAILFQDAGEALVTLAAGSANALSDGGDSEYDGALYSVPSLTIAGDGALEVTGNREEGIATELHLTIDGGTISVASMDDGFNANNDGVSVITINGGDIRIDAGGDGIDSNGSLTINGGRVLAMSATGDMSGGLDCDGELLINGGVVMATGASSTMPAEGSAQRSLALNLSQAQEAGTLVQILEGEELLAAFAPAREYSQVLYSAPELQEGVEYTVLTGGTGSGEDEALAGVYEEAQGGQEQGAVTTQSVEENRGAGGPGGPAGERPEPPEGEPGEERPPMEGERQPPEPPEGNGPGEAGEPPEAPGGSQE